MNLKFSKVKINLKFKSSKINAISKNYFVDNHGQGLLVLHECLSNFFRIFNISIHNFQIQISVSDVKFEYFKCWCLK